MHGMYVTVLRNPLYVVDRHISDHLVNDSELSTQHENYEKRNLSDEHKQFTPQFIALRPSWLQEA